MTENSDLKKYIRDIPDFPEEGIMFHDITTIIQDETGFKEATDRLAEAVKDLDFDVIAGIESRGFIFGSVLSYIFNKGFVLIRKKGKLPAETVSKKYTLEYGTAEIEVHKDAIKPGQKVLIVDDLVATGGTVKAAAELIEELGAEVSGTAFLIELVGLKGREYLSKYEMRSVITYEGK